MAHVKWSVTPDQVFPTIEKWMLRDGFDIVIDMEKSKGSHIVDAKTGDQWLISTVLRLAPFAVSSADAPDEFKEKIFAPHQQVANSDIYTRNGRVREDLRRGGENLRARITSS
jgi:L-lysine 6-transaminase